MPAYVTLPGSSGSFFSTPDVNLLESDDAHFHQSVGNWTAGAGASALAQDTGGTPTPQFGSGTAKATTDGTGAVIATLTTPTLTAVEHTVGVDIYTDTAGREAFITLDGTDGTVTALTAGTWTRLTATKTVTAGTKTVTVTYRQTDDSDPAASEEVWLDQAVLRTGSDGTFVPSSRLVGDIDIEAKFAIDDATPTSRSDLIDCGYNVSSDGYRFTVETSGELGFWFGGSVGVVGEASSGFSNTDGTVVVARVTADISAGDVVWYKDGVQFNTDTFTAQTPIPSGQQLTIGSNYAGAAELFAGDIYYVVVRDGISGPVVARFDADDWVGI